MRGTQQYMKPCGVPGFLLPLTIFLSSMRRSGGTVRLPDPYHCAVYRRLHRADSVHLPQQLWWKAWNSLMFMKT